MSHAFLQELKRAYSDSDGMNERDITRILNAATFAAKKHEKQKRKNPEQTPYIIHPLGVAYQLVTTGGVRDADTLIGALLHDTVEDTDTTFEEIETAFGKRVESIVREVTDNKELTRDEIKRLQVINAPHKSPAAAQIKLADKWYNLNDLVNEPPVGWTKERIDIYFTWAEKVTSALPPFNVALKKAIDETIATYWERS